MNTAASCLKCGAPLTADARGGICPQCLFNLAGAGPSNTVPLPPLSPSRAGLADTPSGSYGGDTEPQVVLHSFGDYELLEEIARGGMGVVYKARQKSLGRLVAVKLILAGQFAGKEVAARFKSEAIAAAVLHHPNIVAVHEVGVHEGQHFFSMDYVKGQNLTELVAQHPLRPREAARYVKLIAEAIHYAHGQGILHRDLKPSNVLIDAATDQPRLTDFGLAKRLDGETSLTVSGQLLGSPHFMPPEQAGGGRGKVGRASDVFGLGGILYFLLTARAPFQGETIEATVQQVLHAEPVSPRLLNVAVAHDLETICLKCLEKEPARRYGTAAEVAEELGKFLNNEPVLACSPSAMYKLRKFIRRNRRPVMAVAALALMLCLGLVGTSLGLIRAKAEALRARFAENEATQDRDRANTARQQAEQARRDERRLNFQMAFDRGLALCDQGNVASGMLWLVRALELAPPGEAAMQRVIRSNLTAWQRGLHILKGIYPHKQGIGTGTFSPDGTLVLTGALDGVVQMWDRRTGLPRGIPLRHEAEVHTTVFSPDGAYFLTTSVDKKARLWETNSRELIREFAHDSAVWAGLFTEDGRIITSNSGGVIQVWDPKTDKPLDAWQHTAHGVHDLSLSPDGKQILGACDNGIVMLWDLQTHQVIARFAGHTGRVPTAVFVTTNRIASADTDGNVFLWTWPQVEAPVDGVQIGKSWRHRGGVHRLRVSDNGAQLLTASFDKRAQLLNSKTGEPIGVPFEHHGALKSVAFSKDGSILTFCEDDAAREWRPAPGCVETTALVHDAGTEQAIFTSDAKYLLIRKEDGTASIRRALTGERVGIPFRPNGGVYGFAISPDESKVMTGTGNGKVQFWETPTGLPFGETFQHSGSAWAVAISQSGEQAVSGGLDGVVKLWDVRTGRPLRTVLALQNAPIRGVAFSPDGARLAIASSDKLAWVVGTDARELPRKLEGHHGTVMTVSFSYDSKQVATGSFDNTVIVWDAKTGLAKSKPMRHGGPFWYAVAFSGDGRTIVAGCDDHTARIWDIATARPIGPMFPHDAALRTAAFTKNDSQIITGTSAGTTYVWDVSRSPLDGDVESIALWLQVSTGMELGADGEVHPLDPETWRQRRQRLEDSSGTRGD